ncbi:2Fe-2S iron-sulfur cluster binding domain-containing protein [Trinickia violacea]|uniref:2Fe-2S iron-sulfur cluster binding domain-containing protein n=1 Tax=Trinickia violacea TaxID=2571746 RepID=A0A4P8IY83_9BURK|nr:pyridoxamine 5'-phosphate oxidase family protein [Trinickia violacea]QCP52925.1 2Fe-2S iron-sulfur cluster binding domain-containing protein [Trinickia violacea]
MPAPAQENDTRSPWHAGELALQQRAGVVRQMDGVGRRVVRDHLIDQHREFYPLIPFVALGAVDAAGDVWATLLAGEPGFLQAPTPDALHVNAMRDPRDPASAGIRDGAAIALIGVELHTRRRNRLNGVVSHASERGFDIGVRQSFGNCNRYIQARQFEFVREPSLPSAQTPVDLSRLDARAAALIAGADTFFVASYVERDKERIGSREVDVSHRGGKRGFVRVGEDGVLTVPDFSGNLFFNTLGNFLSNPKAGLVFADFESGDLLQLTGEAEVDLDSPEIATFRGAERLWRFTPRRIVYRAGAMPLRWTLPEDGVSPYAAMTGSWEESAERIEAMRLADTWRPFRIAKIVDESSVIRSFHLEPADGAGLVPHLAGQHLPIRISRTSGDTPLIRTYTLSVAPSDNAYRISVKRDGVVSQHLHDTLREGDVIEARAPAGNFTIDAHESRPVVLLAGGVGVTPMLAMLRHLVYEGLRRRRIRPAWFFYSARSLTERAFTGEIEALVEKSRGAVRIIRLLTDTEGAVEQRDYDAQGRLDIDVLKATLPFDDFDFYLCGPAGFTQSLYDGLRGLTIADKRIHAESFGPAGLQRTQDRCAEAEQAPTPAQQPVPVVFVASGKEARWTPDDGTLLALAEARGLTPEFGCRAGMCGACRTRIVEGAVAYREAPMFEVPAGEALICCAVPARAEKAGSERLMLDL